jgi:prolyl-tRNA synthetase
MIMGCYGIGVSRLLAAVAEARHDDDGLIWPMSIAPYQVHLIVANAADPTQRGLADSLYDRLRTAGIEVLYDDRPERMGVKRKDADLIGIPLRVVAGKLAADAQVELYQRATKEKQVVAADELLVAIQERINGRPWERGQERCAPSFR